MLTYYICPAAAAVEPGRDLDDLVFVLELAKGFPLLVSKVRVGLEGVENVVVFVDWDGGSLEAARVGEEVDAGEMRERFLCRLWYLSLHGRSEGRGGALGNDGERRSAKEQ